MPLKTSANSQVLLRRPRPLPVLAPPFSTSSSFISAVIVNIISRDYDNGLADQVSPSDEVLWAWLTSAQKWSDGAKRLLSRFTALTPPNQKNALWDRLGLLSHNSPYRGATLGWLLANQGEYTRAEIIFIRALASLPRDRRYQEIAQLLFNTHVHLKHWQQAEALWPSISASQNPDDPSRLPASAAVAAAKSNEATIALTLWKRAINYNRWRNDEHHDLIQAGLAPQLRQVYEDILAAEPDCLPARLYLNSIP